MTGNRQAGNLWVPPGLSGFHYKLTRNKDHAYVDQFNLNKELLTTGVIYIGVQPIKYDEID
jgi:hypothetical protein